MAGQYSTKTFLRQVRVPLLKRYVRQKQIALDVEVMAVKPADIDRLYERLQCLPPDILRKVEADFAAVTELAHPVGTAGLLREARLMGRDWSGVFATANNAYERAMWAYLQDPQLFARAASMVEMDHVASGRWRRWFVGACLPVQSNAAGIAALSQRMKQVYLREGRGQHCHIDHYLRPDPDRHCFFAYPEDHPAADLGYGEDAVLQRRARRSAFEVTFVYRPEDGMLEVLAPGGKARVEELAGDFCQTILDLNELPPRCFRQTLNLNCLLDPDFVFATEPQDRIDAVFIAALQLTLPKGKRRRITFAADPSPWQPRAVHELIAEALNEERVSLEEVKVSHARLRIEFQPLDGERPRRLTFDLSLPDRCSLKDEPYDQIAKRCLRRWGIGGQPAVAPNASAA